MALRTVWFIWAENYGPEQPINQWVESCDLDAHDGVGHVTFTPVQARALGFLSAAEAEAYTYRQSAVKPLRDDGERNRPLRAFDVVFRPFDVTTED